MDNFNVDEFTARIRGAKTREEAESIAKQRDSHSNIKLKKKEWRKQIIEILNGFETFEDAYKCPWSATNRWTNSSSSWIVGLNNYVYRLTPNDRVLDKLFKDKVHELYVENLNNDLSFTEVSLLSQMNFADDSLAQDKLMELIPKAIRGTSSESELWEIVKELELNKLVRIGKLEKSSDRHTDVIVYVYDLDIQDILYIQFNFLAFHERKLVTPVVRYYKRCPNRTERIVATI